MSSECGLLKPDPAIYQHLADSQRILPQESVFMDDMPANVEGRANKDFMPFNLLMRTKQECS